MNKCICTNCQFENFLKEKPQKNKKLFYYKDENTNDEYCIFHASEKIKSAFSYYQNELLKKSINDYINFCLNEKQRIDFSSVIFHIPFDVKDLKTDLKIDFTETIFVEYFRMDNLHCKELIFKDTEFHDGGGIKNRGGAKEVNIEKLIFRPYKLESDFVIDIGKYANNDGLIESDKYGVIQSIRFENHKKGNGIIYFIGLNEYTEEADFRNMILDNVSFQNCDLSQCYFLNSKINKVEFRNCIFPVEQDSSKWFMYALVSGLFLGTLIIYQNGTELYSVLLFIFSILIFLTFSLNSHISVIDEKKIISKNKNEQTEAWKAISEVYRSLKDNLSTDDYQRGGDFFYAQRFSQLQYVNNKYDTFLYFLHYIINGFGENFLRPLIVFILIIIIFSGYYETNKDFVATDNTPPFLVINNKPINYNLPYYKNQIYLDKNKTLKQRQYRSQMLLCIENNKTNTYLDFGKVHQVGLAERFKVKFLYSLSQFISPFTTKNRVWFKTVSSKAAILNIMETILLYVFFGAFILAVKNRIKR